MPPTCTTRSRGPPTTPFFIISYTSFFCAYLLTYNLFAHIYATALEKKIDRASAAPLVPRTTIEDAYIYRKLRAPKFVAMD